MKAIIEQRHTLNTSFGDCMDCALARAIREQHPELVKNKRLMVGGGQIWVSNRRYSFDSDYGSGYNIVVFDDLKNGKLDKFELEIYIPEHDKIQDKKPIKETIRYVAVPASITEQSK